MSQTTAATKGSFVELRAAAATTTTYVPTDEIDCASARHINLFLRLTSTSAGDQVSIVPQGCNDPKGSAAAPNWMPLPATDGSVTEVTRSITMVSGETFTAKKLGSVTVRKLELTHPAIVANSDVEEFPFFVNPCGYRRVRFLVAAIAGTPTATIQASVSH